MGNHIFISYSTRDSKIAFKIVEYLEEHGTTCWIAPRDIESGLDYSDVINNAIKECTAMVLVFSSASIQSQFVKKELTTAVSFNKTILPFKISKVELEGGFLFLLNNVQWIDATSHPESNFPLILNRINKDHNSSSLRVEKPKRNSKRWFLVCVAALLVVGVALWLVLGKKSTPPSEDPVLFADTLSEKPLKEVPVEEDVAPLDKNTIIRDESSPSSKKKEKKEEKNTKVEKNTPSSEASTKESSSKENTEQIEQTDPSLPSTTPQKTQSDSREIRMKKANSYYNQGKYGPALKIYEELKQENPSDISLDKLIKECREKK